MTDTTEHDRETARERCPLCRGALVDGGHTCSTIVIVDSDGRMTLVPDTRTVSFVLERGVPSTPSALPTDHEAPR